MASVVLHLFLPSVYLALIFYAAILFLGDLSVTCSIATLGVVLSALFLLNLSLPPNDKGKVERFLSVEQTEEQQPGDHVSFRKVDDHLTTTKVFTVGHRTLHLEAPENSLSGIKEVWCHFFERN